MDNVLLLNNIEIIQTCKATTYISIQNDSQKIFVLYST